MNSAPSTSNQVIVSIPPPQQPPNLPRKGLIEGDKEDYDEVCVPLYEASKTGNWIAAQEILHKYPWLVRSAITKNYDTMLHIVASVTCTKSVVEFVKKLLVLMKSEDLALKNASDNTAFSLAAAAGNLETAKLMLEKNKYLLEIPGRKGAMPLYVAALQEKEHMLRYLCRLPGSISGKFWDDKNRGSVLQKCVEADILDIAVKIVKDYPHLITSNKILLRDLLLILAEKTYAFGDKKPHVILGIIKSIFAVCHVKVGQDERECDALKLLKMLWKNISNMPEHEIDEIIQGPPSEITVEGQISITIRYPNRVLFVAAKLSNSGFITELIRSCPDLSWNLDDEGLSIYHIAATRRDTKTFNLLYELGTMKDLITSIKDKEGNNMLHLVAKRATAEENESGVSVQMHQDLLWYKEVAKLMLPTYRQRRNDKGETPHDIFKRDHKLLITEGAVWMKDTASQCMVVATLITTMVFAAAFTLPGGYDQNTGIPMFQRKTALIVFVVADAISLIFSSTSVLVFLSMLTSNYTEHDVLIRLPKKLAFGLATLFLSVVSMMVAFSASFIVLYDKNLEWIPIMVICFATIPVLIFAYLQFHLLGDVSFPTYRSMHLLKQE